MEKTVVQQRKLQRDRNSSPSGEASNINNRPTPTCIKPPQPFPMKAQETRAPQTNTMQTNLQRNKNCNAKITAMQKKQQ